MNDSHFSLEFTLTTAEIRRLNKMYFKSLWEEKIRILWSMFFIAALLFNFFFLNQNTDLTLVIINNLILIILFFLFQYSFVKTISSLIFRLIKKLLKFDKFIAKYKFNFTKSLIYVHSPTGEITHKWSHIEKAILTKDFFFLYIKEKNGYIISVSNKYNSERNMEKLLAFIENNVIQITKV